MEAVASGVVGAGDFLFPERLGGVVPPVERLFWRGAWDSEIFKRTVAVVGSRRMTAYGKQVLATLIPQLIAQGYTTVSGFMYGVDIEVHRLTYLNGGRTIGVFGWGIDYEIDTENNNLYHKLLDSHSLFLSEYEGAMSPKKGMFPLRNRIVVGLADAVVVVEGARKSGSLISAHLAVKLGKPLWAVPGPVTSRVSEGTNQLIKDGFARMLTFNDEEFYSKKDAIDPSKLDLRDDESTIVDLLAKRSMRLNELVRATGWDTGRVGQTVMGLTMRGIVREIGGYFEIS